MVSLRRRRKPEFPTLAPSTAPQRSVVEERAQVEIDIHRAQKQLLYELLNANPLVAPLILKDADHAR